MDNEEAALNRLVDSFMKKMPFVAPEVIPERIREHFRVVFNEGIEWGRRGADAVKAK